MWSWFGMAVQVKSHDHIHIYAADPDSSAQFYQDHFGATPISREASSNSGLRIFLALGGQVLVMGGFLSGPAAPPPEAGDGAYTHGFGVAHFGRRVAEVEESVAAVLAAGARVLSPTVREPSGLTYAYVAAPDGVVIELTQYE